MHSKDAIKAIRKAKEVVAWVRIVTEDGLYMPVTKTQAIVLIRRAVDEYQETEGKLNVRVDGDTVYLN